MAWDLFGDNWLTGLVVWWPYSIVSIPNGWHLCDGQDGTPDYRNYMLIGAGDLYNPGQVLGSIDHAHDFDTDEAYDYVIGTTYEDQDCLMEGSDIDYAYYDPYFDQCTEGHTHQVDIQTEGHTHGGQTELTNLLPPCKAGCWIQKM